MLLELLKFAKTAINKNRNRESGRVNKTNNWQLRCAKQTFGVFGRVTATWLTQT
jgi:hypothetical protein